ncbi:hypothetical protein DGG96_02945 [Legionella qingyii]|uniref:Uncharacterized protein n=1 Tax=Legionella qingyii TaxID=2184757 RepID=A0A317U3S6_9GAMM|nr:hypothetical protein [Legionella qingyii]PWY56361.1 hypothetical protein DGG96_06245 [Legionella qingyii]PWY57283.1 hypothetical protein DGG96_02945 [Legionella qingyii]RUR24877.1 hypothetical protein ELY20_03740 [Legionella qingyii]RUR28848.1 hypothetical protein ELY16_02240 [Legionella qingyii]
MFVTHFQKAITYIRETQEIALFATMADARLSAAFSASPLFYIILPFIGFLLTVNALINGFQLAKASNRNVDRWLLFATSAICAALASVSLYGAALSKILGFSFAAGPWFFFSSLLVALTHQFMMFGINLYRAFESPKDSIQRMHYMQAALSNAFAMAFLASALGAVVFVLLFPMAPVLGAGFSITAVLFTGVDLLWRMAPYSVKQLIKGWLHLSKPDVTQDAVVNQAAIFNSKTNEEEPKHHRMFTCCDYSAVIRKMDSAAVKAYLLELIQNKLKLLESKFDPKNEKINDKISLLKTLLKAIENPQKISKKNVRATYPLAFQSFWADKGDVEQILDAVIAFQDKDRLEKHTRLSLDMG